jgi:hypothetical protein
MTDDRVSGVGAKVTAHIRTILLALLENPESVQMEIARAGDALPDELTANLKEILQYKKGKSYRDAAIVQMAFGFIADSAVDLTKRQPSGRSVAQALGALLQTSNIEANNDAFENVGKNSDELCRGNFIAFDDLLRWANDADVSQREMAFIFLLASRASTARQVLPMPVIDAGTLTFVRVTVFFEELLLMSSGGAYQQFSVAACLDALIDEFGQGCKTGLRVQTKNINASDASSGAAADIQIMRANRTEEAIEVTANDWQQKILRAQQIIRSADLPRLLVIASAPPGFLEEAKRIVPPESDISIIDVHAFLATVLAIMRKPARSAALTRLYEHLDRHQSEVERVNAFVRLLRSHGFTST